MKEIVNRLVKKAFLQMGFELRRVSRQDPFPRNSLLGALHQVRKQGWQPRTCIDVGAALGDFSLACARIFPEAQYLLIEPLKEYEPFLTAAVRQLPGAKYIPVAATVRDGSVAIYVHKDLVGSSLYREKEGPAVDGVARTVSAMTLDRLCQEYNTAGPYLLKIDVQGAELEVLKGAEKALQEAEYVILETSFFRFFHGGPEFNAVMKFMEERGFVPYDIWGLKYRPLDRALAQADVAFVKEDGIFRKSHIYATPEQRAAQDASFQRVIAARRQKLPRQTKTGRRPEEKQT
ncbi:FkbM family methyltransferase [Thermodesulfitimonas autotrophica]|uniref:FkbM family methyltransferase n=1 Tax=Thermodesulfitimonas autotrophica TaxID=1894989 RepID=A0A3N5APJ9_9THEO|nr:FkbM family methyltransferase [Thermodesulfitimonas autotrophica]RPF47029.1 FkbM family methyltransferase [Thermodesulfitimonas autotrophica]